MIRRVVVSSFLFALVAVGLSACDPVSNKKPCGSTDFTTPPATYEHVIWIWMENKQYSQVIGNTTDAPYINKLEDRCASGSNYSDADPGGPSLPNYLTASDGLDHNVSPFTADCGAPATVPSASTCQVSGDNVWRQTLTAGKTWKIYAEGMPANCDTSFQFHRYAVRHNPAPYFTGGTDRDSCNAFDVPYAPNFANDLDGATLPDLAMIVPNTCHDMHDSTGCATTNSIKNGDDWLKANLPPILNSGTYGAGKTAVFVVWDEDTPIPNVIVAPSVVPGTVYTGALDHYGLLRTTEEMLGLPCLNGACTATSFRTPFNL